MDLSNQQQKHLQTLEQPNKTYNLKLKVEGVYAFPEGEEGWVELDQNNEFFAYKVHLFDMCIDKGKSNPRQLTEEELKEQEENGKGKKGKEKKKKKGEEEEGPTEEELAALKLAKEQKEEAERIRLEKWNKLNDQEKYWETYEDQFKHPSISFIKPPPEPVEGEEPVESEEVKEPVKEKCEATTEMQGLNLVEFEERVLNSEGTWVYFTRYIDLEEEELGKMNKSKPPKGLTSEQIAPVHGRAWLDLSKLKKVAGETRIEQRCEIEQFFPENVEIEEEEGAKKKKKDKKDKKGDEEEEDQGPPKSTFEFEEVAMEEFKGAVRKSYIHLVIEVDPAVTPKFEEEQPGLVDIIPKYVSPDPPPIEEVVVKEFKAQLVIVIESLAMEYCQMFGRKMRIISMNCANNPFSETKAKQMKEKNKENRERYLYDLNMSGKYKILKETLKKPIIKIVKEKYKMQKSFTGISTDGDRDQFYSKLYKFLVAQMRDTMKELLQAKKDEVHEELMVSDQQFKKERDLILRQISQRKEYDTLITLANDLFITGDAKASDKKWEQALQINGDDTEARIEFIKFCLLTSQTRKALTTVSDILKIAPDSPSNIQLAACLLMSEGRGVEATVYLDCLLQENQQDMRINTLLAFTYYEFFEEESLLGDKFLERSKRILLRKNEKLSQPTEVKDRNIWKYYKYIDAIQEDDLGSQINDPDTLEKGLQLTEEEQDSIWEDIIDLFTQFGLYGLIGLASKRLNTKKPHIAFQTAKSLALNPDTVPQAIEMIENLVKEDPDNAKYQFELGCITFMSMNYEASEIYLIESLKLGSQEKYKTYLLLGEGFKERAAWGNAKACYTRACEVQPKSPVAWLGLGISCLRRKDYDDCENALLQANLYDYRNSTIWGYLALLAIQNGRQIQKANQALREMMKCPEEDFDERVLNELRQNLKSIGQEKASEFIANRIKKIEDKNNMMLKPKSLKDLKIED